MIRDTLIWFVTLFVVQPFQAEMTRTLEAARAPTEIMRSVSVCATDAAPALADRLMTDPAWGVSAMMSVAIGTRTPDAVVGEIAPSCRETLRLARPWITGIGT
jgi:hypothetical protein